MKLIEKNDQRLLHSGFYNIYPIKNEISIATNISDNILDKKKDDLIIDDYYGRVFSLEYYKNTTPYGTNDKLKFYPSGVSGEIIETLRVPYRKIPIFNIETITSIPSLINQIEHANPNYDILLRGQSKIYTVPRDKEELINLYGDSEIKEPSFLPSHLRNNFNENFMHCMWNSQATILLNDIGVEYSKTLKRDKFLDYQNDIHNLRGGYNLMNFSLGIAQHYGMPSVGLDLTKSVEVATWFATHKMYIDEDGIATVITIDKWDYSTIFVFRCPKNAVFSYEKVRPKIFPLGRPDKQDAWFSHVGWGYAKNQLGSYLVCGFRMKKEFIDELGQNYEKELFPSIKEDPILDYFFKMKNKINYQGEAKRALNKLYKLQE